MYWVALEDTDTHEVTEFERVTEQQVLYLIGRYRVDKHDAERFRLHDTEDGANIIYEGVIHKGGFGYDLWVARKYREV